MKVLIVGQGVLRDLLADRLKREKHEIYLLSGEEEGASHLSRYIHYHFALTNERLDFTVRSVSPEAIVFLGACDESYDFSTGRRAAMAYTSGLTNLLGVTAEAGVPKFIYLSSTMVYGAEHAPAITEEAVKGPDDLRGLVVSDGESLCTEFGTISQTHMTCLRFADVYGTGVKDYDSVLPIFRQALHPDRDASQPFVPKTNKRYSPVFISDAVEAVFRVLTSEAGAPGTYNVSGAPLTLQDVYNGVAALVGIAAGEGAPAEQDVTVDSAAFTREYGNCAIIDLSTGLERAHRTITRKSKTETKKAKSGQATGRTLRQTFKPFFENLLIFIAAVAATFWAAGNSAFSQINFMIIYIVIVSITHGIFQASVAILFAGAFIMWQAAQGGGFFDMIIDLNMTLSILQLVLVGVICGYARDRMNTTLYEKDQTMEDQQKEIETINQINESNITIKRTLDDRIKNYDDSLAKIYSIVDKLNSLSSDAVFFSAVSVVMEIMKATDVSIYIVTGDGFKMCRLMAETQSSTRPRMKSVPLNELSALTESFDKHEIFANYELAENTPMMAAPIYSKDELVSIIMLWAVPFDGLTPYNVNRFFVLSQLVSSIIERAFVHSQSMLEINSAPGLEGVLTAEAFSDMYRTHREASRSNTTSCAMLHVSDGQEEPFKDFAQKVKGLLRSTDYVGLNEQDDGTLCLLLSNTNEDELKFVYDRLEKNGVVVEEVHT